MKITLLYFILFFAISSFAQLGNDILIDNFLQADHVAFGDVDGDGFKDLISQEVKWYPQLPNQKFGTGIDVAPCGNRVWADDLNEDGYADLVVTYSDSTVYLQNLGNGTYGNPITIWEDEVSYIYFGDFNFDGIKDIAKEDGWFIFDLAETSFSELQYIPDVMINPQLADLNGDGLKDMLLKRFGTLNLALNDGNGGFEDAEEFAFLTSIVGEPNLVDIEGDGDIDIMALRGGKSVILRNLGNGDFAPLQSIEWNLPNNDNVLSQIIEDLNGDGQLDIVLKSSKRIGWIPQEANQEFYEALLIYEFDDLGFILVEDLDLNGQIDFVFNNSTAVYWDESPKLVAENQSEHDVISVFQNWALPKFLVGDIDADGEEDWIAVSGNGISWRRKLPNTDRFSEVITVSNLSAYDPQLIDKDDDSDLDLFYYRTGNLVINEYDAAIEKFSRRKTLLNVDSIGGRFKVADFNSDGHFDILTTSYGSSDGLRLWTNDGNDKFTSLFLTEKEDIIWMDVFDADQDGDSDVMIIANENTLLNEILYYRNDDGTLVETDITPFSGNTFRGIVELYGNDQYYLIDKFDAHLFDPVSTTFNNDGILLYEFSSNYLPFRMENLIDYDLDGDLDWIRVNNSPFSSSYYVLENDGNVFSLEQTIATGGGFNVSSQLYVGDFTNDGQVDFISGPRLFQGGCTKNSTYT